MCAIGFLGWQCTCGVGQSGGSAACLCAHMLTEHWQRQRSSREPERHTAAEVAERHFLCFGNTFFPCSPTFYSNSGSHTSRTDYILLPQSLLPQIRSCAVWDRAGDALQLIDCPARRDHRPVVLTVHIQLQYCDDPTQHVRWDHDKLSRCLQGDGADQFVQAVEGALEGVEWKQLAEQSGPDTVHHTLHHAIHAQAVRHFTQPRTAVQHRIADPELAAATLARQRARLQLRALRNDPPDDPGTQHAMQQATQRCQSTTSRVRQLKRSRWKKHQAALVQEITDAWRRRDFATAWRVSRLLGGSRVGPKKRSMAAPAPIYSQQEWAQFLARPGPEGGVAARPPTDSTNQPDQPTRLTREHLRAGVASAWRTKKQLHYSKLRKTPPPWSFPVAVWRILLERSNARPPRRLGLGATSRPVPARQVQQGFHILHSSMLATCSTPHSWHRSGAFTTPKTNGKTGPAGQRLLHTLESLGKAYYAQVWKQLRAHYSRPYASGYLPHRRREQAILQQSLLRHRLQKAKISHTTAFYDLANAFASASHCHTLQPVVTQSNLPIASRAATPTPTPQPAHMVLQCADGELRCRIGSGTLPGDSIAGAWFLAGYHNKVDTYLQNTSTLAIPATRPAAIQQGDRAANQLDVSLTTYADDVARTVQTNTALQMHTAMHFSSQQLTQALAPDFQQNEEKQEVLPFFGGSKALTHLRNAFTIPRIVPGKVLRNARYLGPYLAYDGKLHDERGRRVQAAKKAFYTLGKFWAKCSVLRWRQAIFRSMVCGAAYSGLSSFVVESADTVALDKTLAQLGRKVLQGKACEKGDKHKAATTQEVFRLLRSVPSSTNLAMERLCWWQQIARHQEAHYGLLYTFFGSIPNTPDPLTANGAPHPQTHAWMRQRSQDLRKLAESSEDDLLFIAADQPACILHDPIVREAFLKADPKVLKARFLGVAITPPGWEAPHVRADEAEEEQQFTCNMVRHDGQVCATGSATVRHVSIHLPCRCAVCDAQFESLREAQDHLVTHLPLPFRRARLDHYWRHG